ncbi:MAG: serine--tRNA ligase [Candidatus Daviesbacteria bacterium]|nr:serine--tRNA ligase [Candidatus Daviesbacteria bacterium]
MLDINFIRENLENVKEGIKNKSFDSQMVDDVLKLNEKRVELLMEVEKLREERNGLDQNSIEKGKEIKEKLKNLEPELDTVEKDFNNLLSAIPNLPGKNVPIGKNETENVELSKWGDPTKLDFQPKDHLVIGRDLGILDFETGAKVAGSQFYFLKNEGALLELALIQYALHLLSDEGLIPIITPDLAKSKYYLGTGYNPKGDEAQTYEIKDEDLGLIATAEVTLAGMHADEIIPEEKLPLKYVGYSHCFRKEAGAYGKYSKGLYRVHQFTKAEIFIYCLPEESNKMHEHILSLEEKIYQDLKIPYRVLEMCTGDLGVMASRKFDIEAWMPGRNEYGEVTSTSNCTDYQARNLKIRIKRKDGKVEYAHMLNGTAIATSRTIIAILENFQQADGSVKIPEVLQKYTGFSEILPKKS